MTIVAFTLERYLATCHPLHTYAVAGLRRALRIVLVLWVVSLLAASPFAHYTAVNYHDYPPTSGNASMDSAFCAMLELPSWYICELSSFFFFLVPGIVILCLYVRMGLRIRSTQSNSPGCPGTLNGVNRSVHGEARQAQSRKNIIRMLAAVVITFFVCWAPLHFQRLFFIYGSSVRHYDSINEYLFLAAGAFYYISATVNPILYNIMSRRATYVSVMTIVAFTLERYLAICHPLHIYAVAGLRRALRIVLVLWVVSLLAASPFAHYTTVNYHDYHPTSGNASMDSAFCALLELPSWYICELSSFFFFLLPGIVILCLYVRMGLRIRSTQSNSPGCPGTLNGVNGSVHGEARQAQSRKNIIRMLAAVVIAFFVCWAPFHFQRLFFIYGSSVRHYDSINEYLFLAAGAFYYISATVNPILYNIMSHRYRIAFKETLCCRKVNRKKSRYRDQSSVRETTVNHTSDGSHLVRVRSSSRKRRSRSNPRNRNSSSSDTSTLYSDRWKDYNTRDNELWKKNNNEANQLMLKDYKYDCEL